MDATLRRCLIFLLILWYLIYMQRFLHILSGIEGNLRIFRKLTPTRASSSPISVQLMLDSKKGGCS
ncbi:hypothetical protein [Pasteuria penetrans]|uniref:hypothetical protein n=1 Tax=Pasteuria penetrans TaxID=86005 RepID=UPI000FAAFA33|nr:hypothetical protein [Pasteuria penetrans]